MELEGDALAGVLLLAGRAEQRVVGSRGAEAGGLGGERRGDRGGLLGGVALAPGPPTTVQTSPFEVSTTWSLASPRSVTTTRTLPDGWLKEETMRSGPETPLVSTERSSRFGKLGAVEGEDQVRASGRETACSTRAGHLDAGRACPTGSP